MSNPRSRSLFATLVGVLAVAVLVAGCGDDDDGDETPSSTSSSMVADDGGDDGAAEDPATADIQAAYSDMFDATLPDAERVAQLEDPEVFGPLLARGLAEPGFASMMEGLDVRIENVVLTSDTTAEGDLVILVNGEPAMPGAFVARATLVDGKWKVAGSTLCSLLALGDPSYASDPACAG